MKCGLVAADGAVLHRETRPTPRDAGARAVLDALLETVVELGQKAAADGHRVRAVGVVVPGIIDAEHGTVSAENLAWVDVRRSSPSCRPRSAPTSRSCSPTTSAPAATPSCARAL